jgi:hypothetical protein
MCPLTSRIDGACRLMLGSAVRGGSAMRYSKRLAALAVAGRRLLAGYQPLRRPPRRPPCHPLCRPPCRCPRRPRRCPRRRRRFRLRRPWRRVWEVRQHFNLLRCDIAYLASGTCHDTDHWQRITAERKASTSKETTLRATPLRPVLQPIAASSARILRRAAATPGCLSQVRASPSPISDARCFRDDSACSARLAHGWLCVRRGASMLAQEQVIPRCRCQTAVFASEVGSPQRWPEGAKVECRQRPAA